MRISKRVVTFIVLMLAVLTVRSFATTENYEVNYENQYDFNSDIYSDSSTIENDELFEFLIEQSKQSNEVVDVSSYKIPEENAKAVITQIFLNENTYYLKTATASSYEDGYLKEITFTYLYSLDEITAYEEKLSTISQDFISGVQSSWCDMEKILYTDLYLCQNVEAGSENEYSSHTIVGALINGSASSDGYAKAFNYLVKQIGINSIIVTSSDLSSAWNMVETDGEYYHIDVSFNDISGYGKTSYEYIFRTDDEMTNYYSRTWVSSKTSSENIFDADWLYADTYLQYKDGYWYYAYSDYSTLEIDRYSFEILDYEIRTNNS